MELIRISDSKLKIVLSSADMEQYGIRCDTADYANTETRRAVWTILDEAKKQTGFDAGGNRVYIQMYPSRGGGCELYVTKREGRACVGAKDTQKSSLGMYRFSCLGHLLSVCSLLQKGGFLGESSAYAEGERYYLVLREMHTHADAAHKNAFIEEYGERLSGSERLSYIEEYATPILPSDAVGVLSSLR